MGNPTPELVSKLKAIPGVKQVEKEGEALTIVSAEGSDNLDRILQAAQGSGGVRSVVAEKPTLEDVFLTLTGKSLRDGGES